MEKCLDVSLPYVKKQVLTQYPEFSTSWFENGSRGSGFKNRVSWALNLQQTRHVAQDWGYHPWNFYLIYTDLSISEKLPLWKVLYLIFLFIIGYNNISWRPHSPSPQNLRGHDLSTPQDRRLCLCVPTDLLFSDSLWQRSMFQHLPSLQLLNFLFLVFCQLFTVGTVAFQTVLSSPTTNKTNHISPMHLEAKYSWQWRWTKFAIDQ